jgi:hypothetical protein
VCGTPGLEPASADPSADGSTRSVEREVEGSPSVVMLALDHDGLHVPQYDLHPAGLVHTAARPVHVRDADADTLDDVAEAPEPSLELAPDVEAERVVEHDSARPDMHRLSGRLDGPACFRARHRP